MDNLLYQIGDVQFNPEDKELIFNRFRSVRLTTRESKILQYLVDNPNKAITLAEILSNCLGEYQSDPIATRKTIQLLSNKLELADRIEYPYIDCYMFRYDPSQQNKTSRFTFVRLKSLLSRMPQVSRVIARFKRHPLSV